MYALRLSLLFGKPNNKSRLLIRNMFLKAYNIQVIIKNLAISMYGMSWFSWKAISNGRSCEILKESHKHW